MKKLAVTLIGGLFLSAVPALADEASRAAPVRNDFLTIGGPKRLKARATLKVPIRCSVGCDTTARTKLKLPGSTIPPDIAKGHLAPRDPKNLIVKLNDAATDTIEEHPNASRLRVKVTAVYSTTGERVQATKVFRFRTS